MLKIKKYKIIFSIIGGVLALIIAIIIGGYTQNERIFRYFLSKINDDLKGQISVQKFSFAPFSKGFGMYFSLGGISLHDSAYAKHKKAFLVLDKLILQVDAFKLISGEINIQSLHLKGGKIHLFVDKTGNPNWDLFKSKKDTTQSDSAKPLPAWLHYIKGIDLTDIKFVSEDLERKKYISFMVQGLNTTIQDDTDSLWNFNTKGEVYFDSLTFNIRRGGFLKNKAANLNLNLSINKIKRQSIAIKPSEVKINADNFKINGAVVFNPTQHLQLNIETDTIAAPRALSILSKELAKKIARFNILPVVKAQVQLDAPLKGGDDPWVNIFFQTHEFKYESPIGLITKVIANGNFTNQSDTTKPIGDENSHLIATGIEGLFYESIPMRANLKVTDFSNPHLVMNGDFITDLININNLFETDFLNFKTGNATIKYTYEGAVDPIFDKSNKRLNGKLKGTASVTNGSFVYVPQKLVFSKVSTAINFTESIVNMEKLHLYYQKNHITMNGKANGLVPYAFNVPTKVKAELNVYTPMLGLGWLQLYKKPVKKSNPKRFTQLIENLLEQLDVHALVIADHVQFRQFHAYKVRGKAHLSRNSVGFDNVTMNAFGGRFNLTGGIKDFDSPISILYANGKISDANVKKVFQSFENFKQSTLTEQHLNGDISTVFNYTSSIKDDFSILPLTMNGKLSLQIKRGELNNFTPIKRIQKILFKKRDFENIDFNNLNNEFLLKHGDIYFKDFKVASSALTFFMSGIYSFGKNTDLIVKVPIRNMKRNIDVSQIKSADGSNFVIRAVDENGELKLKYKLQLRKRRKNQNVEDSTVVEKF